MLSLLRTPLLRKLNRVSRSSLLSSSLLLSHPTTTSSSPPPLLQRNYYQVPDNSGDGGYGENYSGVKDVLTDLGLNDLLKKFKRAKIDDFLLEKGLLSEPMLKEAGIPPGARCKILSTLPTETPSTTIDTLKNKTKDIPEELLQQMNWKYEHFLD